MPKSPTASSIAATSVDPVRWYPSSGKTNSDIVEPSSLTVSPIQRIVKSWLWDSAR